jgi:hypothetical protein
MKQKHNPTEETMVDAFIMEMMNAHIYRATEGEPVIRMFHRDNLSTPAGATIRDIAERKEYSHVVLEFGTLEGPRISFVNG